VVSVLFDAQHMPLSFGENTAQVQSRWRPDRANFRAKGIARGWRSRRCSGLTRAAPCSRTSTSRKCADLDSKPRNGLSERLVPAARK